MSKKMFGWIAGIEISIFTLLQGSAVTLGLLVAPLVFITIKSRDLAGQVFGNILHVWFFVSLVCALILLATSVFTLIKVKPTSRLLVGRVVCTGLTTALILGFAYTLFRIDAIQATLTKPIDDYPANVDPRREFDLLHGISTDLISAALVVGLVWLILSVVATVKLSGPRESIVSNLRAGSPEDKKIPSVTA